jgi:hypothetical protein
MITLSTKKSLTKLFQLNQLQLKKAVTDFLKKHYEKVVETEYYVYAAGEYDVALVAHLDTVCEIDANYKQIFCDIDKGVFWCPTGLGADDRAGVYGIIQLIEKYNYKPHVIFTVDEEIGGIGAQALAAIKNPFSNLKYIIQLDRQGEKDCVFYKCGNKEFQNYVASFDFTIKKGSYSDISFICPIWGVAGVNLSIGYENEHTYGEHFFYHNFWSTLQKVRKMLDDSKNVNQFEYIENNEKECAICHKSLGDKEGMSFLMNQYQTITLCKDCAGGL